MIVYDKKHKGRPLHIFRTKGGIDALVVRGNCTALAYLKKERIAAVIAAPGISYHQAALWALEQVEAGKFKPAAELLK